MEGRTSLLVQKIIERLKAWNYIMHFVNNTSLRRHRYPAKAYPRPSKNVGTGAITSDTSILAEIRPGSKIGLSMITCLHRGGAELQWSVCRAPYDTIGI